MMLDDQLLPYCFHAPFYASLHPLKLFRIFQLTTICRDCRARSSTPCTAQRSPIITHLELGNWCREEECELILATLFQRHFGPLVPSSLSLLREFQAADSDSGQLHQFCSTKPACANGRECWLMHLSEGLWATSV
jgi:hypothetical protein